MQKIILFLVLFVPGTSFANRCVDIFLAHEIVASTAVTELVSSVMSNRQQTLDYKINFIKESIISMKREGYSFSQLELRVLQTIIGENLSSLSDGAIGEWLLKFGVEQTHYTVKFSRQLQKDFIDRSEEYSGSTLQRMIVIVKESGVVPTKVFHEKLESTLRRVRTSMTADELFYFNRNYTSIFEHNSSRKIISELQAGFIAQHKSFSAIEAANFFSSISLAKIKPSKRFVRIINKILIENIHSVDEVSLVYYMIGLATLKVELSAEFKAVIVELLLNNMLNYSLTGVSSVLYSLFLLGEFSVVKDIINRNRFLVDPTTLNEESATRLHVIKIYFEKVLMDPLDQLLSGHELYKEEFFDTATRSTHLENRVERGLVEQGVSYEKEYRVSSGFFVDFYVAIKNLIIQADGPTHFLTLENGQREYLLKDIRFNEIHEALGYKILRIPYFDL